AVLRERRDLPHALALDAEIGGVTRTDLPKALAAIHRARTLAPGRETYAFTEANIQTQLGDYAAARKLLGPLMSPAATPEVREHARRVMTYVVEREQNATERARA